MRLFFKIFSLFTLLFLYTTINALELIDELTCLQRAYPDHIQSVSPQVITWKDGTTMPIHRGNLNKTQQEKLDSPALYDQLHEVYYPWGGRGPGELNHFLSTKEDPGRIRYEPFFRKMYGDSIEAVKKKIVTINWMPKVFGKIHPLQVTTVNGINEKLMHISDELEKLVLKYPSFKVFLTQPGGTFQWRLIAHTKRLSPHSFGMTIDINSQSSNYWQWDLKKAGKSITENEPLNYRNHIPQEIVDIFEKYGFIWGGKWYHYDTMHFEYRPELKTCAL